MTSFWEDLYRGREASGRGAFSIEESQVLKFTSISLRDLSANQQNPNNHDPLSGAENFIFLGSCLSRAFSSSS